MGKSLCEFELERRHERYCVELEQLVHQRLLWLHFGGHRDCLVALSLEEIG